MSSFEVEEGGRWIAPRAELLAMNWPAIVHCIENQLQGQQQYAVLNRIYTEMLSDGLSPIKSIFLSGATIHDLQLQLSRTSIISIITEIDYFREKLTLLNTINTINDVMGIVVNYLNYHDMISLHCCSTQFGQIYELKGLSPTIHFDDIFKKLNVYLLDIKYINTNDVSISLIKPKYLEPFKIAIASSQFVSNVVILRTVFNYNRLMVFSINTNFNALIDHLYIEMAKMANLKKLDICFESSHLQIISDIDINPNFDELKKEHEMYYITKIKKLQKIKFNAVLWHLAMRFFGIASDF